MIAVAAFEKEPTWDDVEAHLMKSMSRIDGGEYDQENMEMVFTGIDHNGRPMKAVLPFTSIPGAVTAAMEILHSRTAKELGVTIVPGGRS